MGGVIHMSSKIHPSKHLLRWCNLDFCVTPKDIVGVGDISITGSCDTEDKEGQGERYVSRKAAKPIEFTMKVTLNAYLTNDVKQKALDIVRMATLGHKDYIYMGKGKLLPCRFMLASAKTQNVKIAAGVTWVSCTVDLVFRQCSKYDGTEAPEPATGGGGSRGGERKKQSVRNTKSSFWSKPKTAVEKANELKKTIAQATAQNKLPKKQTAFDIRVNAAKQKKQSGGSIKQIYREPKKTIQIQKQKLYK